MERIKRPLKRGIVWTLVHVAAWHLPLAERLARLVTLLWPGFKGA